MLKFMKKSLGTVISLAITAAILCSFSSDHVFGYTAAYSIAAVSQDVFASISLDSFILTPMVAESLAEIKEEIENPAPEYVEYIVKIGDTLKSIATAAYNDPNMQWKIAEDNGGNPRLLAGDILKLYPTEYVDGWALQDAVNSLPEGKPQNNTTKSPDIGNNLMVEAMTIERAVAYIKNAQSGVDTSQFTYIGNFRITGYDPHCRHCCGKTDGITGSGRPAEFGISVGASYNVPKGTLLYAEGYGFYRVDDRGANKNSDSMIDIACPSHDVCRFMTGRANMYVVEYP